MYIKHFDRSVQSSRSSDSTISCGEALLEAARMLDSQLDRCSIRRQKELSPAGTAQGGGNSGCCRAKIPTAFGDIVLRDLFGGYTEWDGQLIGINVFPLPPGASIPTSRFVERFAGCWRQQCSPRWNHFHSDRCKPAHWFAWARSVIDATT